MQLKVLSQISAANNKLPDDAYFAYQNIEIFEFILKVRPGIQLKNDTFIEVTNLSPRAFSFAFD